MKKKLPLPTRDQLYRECIRHLRTAVLHALVPNPTEAMFALDQVAHAQRILIEQEVAQLQFDDDLDPNCLVCKHLGRSCGRHAIEKLESMARKRAMEDAKSKRPLEAKPGLDNETVLAMFGRYVINAMTDYEQWSADMLDEIAERAKQLNLCGDDIEFKGRSDLLYRESEVEREASRQDRADNELKRLAEEGS